MNTETRSCQNCKSQFTIEPEDFQFYERIKVPPPTWCPECRTVRRMQFRNERSLYRRKCDLCGREKIGMYSPDKPFKVYCRDCWFGDGWNPMDYGRDYDFSRPFFQQFYELMLAVPRVAVVHFYTNTNSDYANFIADNKNVYLAYSIVDCENIFYSYAIDKSKDCSDCLFLKNSELCYENIDGSKNYNCRHLFRSRDCVGSDFLFDCANCQYCFMSSNLRNKQYVFKNKELSKDEYEQRLKEVNFGSHQVLENLKGEYREMVKAALHKFANVIKVVDSYGDNLNNCKNVRESFNLYDAENSKFAIRGFNARDAYDVYGAVGELIYEGVVTGWNTSGLQFFTYASGARDSQYTDWCHDSVNLFGCVGLRNKQYCVFNKQYSKEDYDELIARIIEHMNSEPYLDSKGRSYRYGEFFPLELSPFAYNETLAQEQFPINKEEAAAKGYRWKDSGQRHYVITKKIGTLPDDIKEVDESILKEVIECEHQEKCQEQCTQAFKIIPEELQFYRRMNLPLPRLCPNCRHYQRLKQRNPLKLWHRACHCRGQEGRNPKFESRRSYKNTSVHFHGNNPCLNEFKTPYALDREEIIYCEQCYNAEVV